MAIYHDDIVNVELTSGSIHRSFLNRSIGEGDSAANRFGVTLKRNGEPVTLDGVTCMGYFIRPTGDTVVITGTVSGLNAYVTIPQACYVTEGNFTLAIKLVGSGVTGTMRIIDGTVVNTTTDTLIDPGSVIPDIQDLIAVIEEAEIALEGTVRYDIAQGTTASEKEQARANIEGQIDIGLFISNGYIYQTVTT